MVADGLTRERTSARKAMGNERLSGAGDLPGAPIVGRTLGDNPGF
jgi:hypothetical protein